MTRRVTPSLSANDGRPCARHSTPFAEKFWLGGSFLVQPPETQNTHLFLVLYNREETREGTDDADDNAGKREDDFCHPQCLNFKTPRLFCVNCSSQIKPAAWTQVGPS
jgi:hypothetical protein